MDTSDFASGQSRNIADGKFHHLACGDKALAGDLVIVGFAQVAEDIEGFLRKAQVFKELGEGVSFANSATLGFVFKPCHNRLV